MDLTALICCWPSLTAQVTALTAALQGWSAGSPSSCALLPAVWFWVPGSADAGCIVTPLLTVPTPKDGCFAPVADLLMLHAVEFPPAITCRVQIGHCTALLQMKTPLDTLQSGVGPSSTEDACTYMLTPSRATISENRLSASTGYLTRRSVCCMVCQKALCCHAPLLNTLHHCGSMYTTLE